jgi:Formate/nitrite transporter
MPAAMAVQAEESGIKRAALDPLACFVLSVLAGAFVAFGAIFATTVSAGTMTTFASDGSLVSSAALPYGIGRLLVGLAFCVGILAVIIAGAELFTGNNLVVMAWASRKVTRSFVQLDAGFCREFARRHSHCGSDVLDHAVHLRRRCSRPRRLEYSSRKDLAAFPTGLYARHHVQRARLPSCLDVLQCQDECRSGGDRSTARRSIRGGRIRALCCKCLLHSNGAVYQGRCA